MRKEVLIILILTISIIAMGLGIYLIIAKPNISKLPQEQNLEENEKEGATEDFPVTVTVSDDGFLPDQTTVKKGEDFTVTNSSDTDYVFIISGENYRGGFPLSAGSSVKTPIFNNNGEFSIQDITNESIKLKVIVK